MGLGWTRPRSVPSAFRDGNDTKSLPDLSLSSLSQIQKCVILLKFSHFLIQKNFKILLIRAISDVPVFSIYSFSKYLLSTSYVPDPELDTKPCLRTKETCSVLWEQTGARNQNPGGSAETHIKKEVSFIVMFYNVWRPRPLPSEGLCSDFMTS